MKNTSIEIALVLLSMVLTMDAYSIQEQTWWDVNLDETIEKVVHEHGFVKSNELNVVMTRHDSGQTYTNFIPKVVQDLGRSIDLSPISLSPEKEQIGVTFIDGNGEDQNSAIEIGFRAKAKIPQSYIDGIDKPTILRSVSIAIGDYADAVVPGGKSQAIAIGWHAQAKSSNAIAIGNGAQHPNEDVTQGTGDATYASGSESIALGYSARSVTNIAIAIGGKSRASAINAISIGSHEGNTNAEATARGSVQIGAGKNSEMNTLQFRQWQIVNKNGQIPTNRLELAFSAMRDGVLNDLLIMMKNGNTTIVGDGVEHEEDELDKMQNIQPMLRGVTEIKLQPNTNGVFMAGTTIGVEPPLGQRNFDLVFMEIPQCKYESKGELLNVPEDSNFIISFSQLPQSKNIKIAISPEIGYTNGLYATITNAPFVLKMREPSTNSIWCVIKQWDLIQDL